MAALDIGAYDVCVNSIQPFASISDLNLSPNLPGQTLAAFSQYLVLSRLRTFLSRVVGASIRIPSPRPVWRPASECAVAGNDVLASARPAPTFFHVPPEFAETISDCHPNRGVPIGAPTFFGQPDRHQSLGDDLS